jgi:hypothetical protein
MVFLKSEKILNKMMLNNKKSSVLQKENHKIRIKSTNQSNSFQILVLRFKEMRSSFNLFNYLFLLLKYFAVFLFVFLVVLVLSQYSSEFKSRPPSTFKNVISHNSILNSTSNYSSVIKSINFNNQTNLTLQICSDLPDTLEGELDVIKIIESFNLSTLIKLHEKNSYDLLKNRYKGNIEIFYLDVKNRDAKNKHPRFDEFWELWHTNSIALLNISNEYLGTDGKRVELGGSWRPDDCIPRYKIAIIIPFRDRIPHLRVALQYLHYFVQKQKIEYRIFVVEPNSSPDINFNKGRSMNAAFIEVLKLDPTLDCIIFHDVDLLPEVYSFFIILTQKNGLNFKLKSIRNKCLFSWSIH